MDRLAFCGSHQPLEPPAFVLRFCTASRPRTKLRHTALVVGREHRKVVEHGLGVRPEHRPRTPQSWALHRLSLGMSQDAYRPSTRTTLRPTGSTTTILLLGEMK
jgi:hypothetical protein